MSTFSNTELTERDVVVVTTSYPVGDCLCPDGFTGISCQDCSQGHYRLSGDIRDMCLRCECNNQTQKCNSTSGVCHNCTGNTVGDNCEHCISGYYGDPTRGIPCIECSCPLIENSFSGTCFLDYDDQQTCDSCELGYTGRNCEICMDGYFGNPLVRPSIEDRSVSLVLLNVSRLGSAMTVSVMAMWTQHLVQCVIQLLVVA